MTPRPVTVQVNSRGAFMRQVEAIRGESRDGSGATVVFRGQNRKYPAMIASAHRPGSPAWSSEFRDSAIRLYSKAYKIGLHNQGLSEADEYEAEVEKYGTPIGGIGPMAWPTNQDWESFAEILSGEWLPPGGPSISMDDHEGCGWAFYGGNHVADSFLQHYGVPTPSLDATYDPLVALWFATHSFVWTDKAAARATYTPAVDGSGVVYALTVVPDDIRDLRSGVLFPTYGLRGKAQSGALLLPPSPRDGHHDFAEHVTHVMEIANSAVLTPGDSEGALPAYSDLFPARDTDRFYDVLLSERDAPMSEFAELVRHVVDYEH